MRLEHRLYYIAVGPRISSHAGGTPGHPKIEGHSEEFENCIDLPDSKPSRCSSFVQRDK